MTDKEIINAFNKKRKSEIRKAVIRPKFTLYRELLQLIAALLILSAGIYWGHELSVTKYLLLLFAVFIFFFLSQIKNILLLMIFCYQKFAPSIVRNACLFTPSCSEYMRLSIIKYGAFKGVRKGIDRLRRCHLPNGGIDEP